jgi:DNA-directed RNA polymerase specialized sigma24 family protein
MQRFWRRHRDRAEIESAVLEGIWEVRKKFGANQPKQLLARVVLRTVIDRLREVGYISRPHQKWRGGGAHGDALNFVERIPDFYDRPHTARDVAEYEDLVRSIAGMLNLPAEYVKVLKEYDPNSLHVKGGHTAREQNRTSYILWRIRTRAARHRMELTRLFGVG